MRRTRRIFLLGILVILTGVGATYYLQRTAQLQEAPAAPKPLPTTIQATSRDWIYSHSDGKRVVVEVSSRDMRQLQEPDQLQLDQVELRLFHKDGRVFDRVRSASAVFHSGEGFLYADGEVEITLAVPAEAAPSGRLLQIRSSGVRFAAKTGVATTERAATFEFDRGEGQAVGASYDPASRELRMSSQVRLRWWGSGPRERSMQVETGELAYKESEAKVFLLGWSRFERANTTLEAGNAVITLQDGRIRQVEAQNARGRDQYPKRRIEYSASRLDLWFSADAHVEKCTGEGEARMVASTDTAVTTMTSDRVDMEFAAAGDDSLLSKVRATGRSAVESRPLAAPGAAETRVVKSEVVELVMRAGGEELELVQTHTPGSLEFLPNGPGQRRRRMDADRIWIHYGPSNRIRSLRAVEVATSTENEPKKGQRAGVSSRTWSRDLAAEFDPKTGQLARLEQWQQFRYEQGDRQATAARAVQESAGRRMVLEGKARVWDAAGSVAAERIVLEQDTDDFTAEGGVVSTRLPERKSASSAMLSSEEPSHATAARMLSTEDNGRIVYEGGAVLWQSANRLQADRIEIDRKSRQLRAAGNVISEFADADGKAAPGKVAPPAKALPYTVVRAPELLYREQERLAHYRGGAQLVRGSMEVRAREIRAFLKERGKDSSSGSLERALAEGAVEISQRERDRSRRGASEQADYQVDQEKILLSGGHPQFHDSLRGSTRGRQLTYFSRDDRLLVDGEPAQPAISRIRRP